MSLKSICFSLWLPIPSFTTATAAIGSSYYFPFKNQSHSVSHFGYSRPHRLHCSNKLDSISDEDDCDYDEDSKEEQSDLDVELEIEEAGQNCRRIRSEIGIEAPLSTVWDVLTDYERLADFIPGLAVCQLLHRKDNYARLFQIGEQDLAFGLKFNAKGIVDCYENALESIPSELGGGQTLRRDIEFNMVEGDFEIFRGKWSLQQLNTSREIACDSLVDQQMHTTTTLSYVVDVKPKMWLPVRLVEGRLCKEIKINLASIREEALKITRGTLLTP